MALPAKKMEAPVPEPEKLKEEIKPEQVEKEAEELGKKAQAEKKGFSASVKDSANKLRGKHWEKLGKKESEEIRKELEELKEEAEEATEEFEGEAEKIVEAKEAKLKAKLEKAREKFANARAKLKKFQGVMGGLRRLTKKQEAMNAEVDVEETRDRYLEQRAEYVAENVEKHVKEATALADAQAEAFQKERGFGRKIYDAYKKLGEWNLTKLGIKPKSRVGKMIARAASVRTLVGASLVAGGSALAAVGAAGAAAGAFAARRAFGGLGAGIGSYDVIKMTADRKLGKEVSDRQLQKMNTEDIRKRLEYFEAIGPMNGKKPSELPGYIKLRDEYANRLNAEIAGIKQAEEKGEKPKVETYENVRQQTFEDQKDYIQGLLVKELQLLTAGLAQKERMKKAKTAKEQEQIKKMHGRIQEELDKLSKRIGDNREVEDLLVVFQEKNDLFDNPISALQKIKEGFVLKPEFQKKFDKFVKEDKRLNKSVDDFAKAFIEDASKEMQAEKEKSQERADAVQKKLSEMAEKDLTEIEKRRKQARKNDVIMKGVAAGIGVFVGSGGMRWLLKQTGFVQDSGAKGITGRQAEELGVQRRGLAEMQARPRGGMIGAEEMEGPEMEIKPEVPIEGGTTIQKGDGMIKAMNRILAENPELKSQLGGPKEIRAWRIKQLKDMGFDLSGKRWTGPITLEEGDKINIVRAPDGSLKVQVIEVEEPAAMPHRVVKLSPEEAQARKMIRAWDAQERAYARRLRAGTLTEQEMAARHAKLLDDLERMEREKLVAKIEAEKAAAAGRPVEPEAPSRPRAGIEAAEPAKAPKVAEAPAEEAAAEAAATGPTEAPFKGENITGGKVFIKETPRGLIARVEGQVRGMGADDYIKKGVLKENFIEELNRPSSTMRGAALNRARTLYMYEEALKSAKAQGNERMVDALRRTIRSHKAVTKRGVGDIFG